MSASDAEQHQSEDCLYANVYAPSDATPNSKYPVYVFIQGGGYNSNANANMNGSALVEQGDKKMLVVNFNYRVGPYGFLASKEAKAGASLNNGLKDQLQLLRWVNQFIDRFGGDPGQVVLGGASAGAGSVVLQLTYKGGKGVPLFHAVAAESQNMPPIRTVEESQYLYDQLSSATGCNKATDSLQCMRKMDTVSFQKASRSVNPPFPGAQDSPVFLYSPTLDQDFIQDYTYREFDKGNFYKMPSIFGDDSNEGTIFTPRNMPDQAAADRFLKDQFPAITSDQLSQIHAKYPKGAQYPDTGAYWSVAAEMFGDMRYACPGLYITNAFNRHGRTDSWHYRWDLVSAANEANGNGATHVEELGAVWSGGSGSNGKIHNYWASFIRTLDPNKFKAADMPTWNTWGGTDGYNRVRFGNDDVSMEKVSDWQKSQCALLQPMGVSLMQ